MASHLMSVPCGIRCTSCARLAGSAGWYSIWPGERGRDGHDHALGVHLEAVGVHLHAALALGDAAHRHPQLDPVPERRGHPDRDQLRAAVEPALLGAAPGGDEPHEAAGVLLVPGRGYVEQDVEQRQVARLGAPVRLHRGREEALARPRSSGSPVPSCRASGSRTRPPVRRSRERSPPPARASPSSPSSAGRSACTPGSGGSPSAG